MLYYILYNIIRIEVVMKNRNKFLYLTGGILILLLIILGVYVAYYLLVRDPKIIIKRSINTISTYLNSSAQNIEDNLLLSSDTYEFNTALSLKIEGTELERDTFKINGIYDLNNKKFQLTTSFLEDDTNIIDFIYMVDNENKYMKSNTLFNNLYSLNNYICDGNKLLCSIFNKELFNVDNNDNIKIVTIINNIRDGLINNISKDNTSYESIDGLNKYSYIITKDDLNRIYDNLDKYSKDILINLKELLYGKNYTEDILEGYSDIHYEIYLDSESKFNSIKIYNNDMNITFDKYFNGKIEIPEYEIEGTIEKDKFDIEFSDGYSLEGSIKVEDNNTDIYYKLNLEILILEGNIDKKEEVQDSYIDGLINMSLNGDISAFFGSFSFDTNLALDYDISKDIKSSYISIDNPLDVNNFTDEDIDIYTAASDRFSNTYIGSYIKNYFNLLINSLRIDK